MMQQQNQDFYNARDLRNTLLDDLQLPEQSTITLKKNYNGGKSTEESFKNQSNKHDRYLQGNQDDQQHDQVRITIGGFDELPQVSNIQKKKQVGSQPISKIEKQNHTLQRQKSKIIPSTSKRIQSGISRVSRKGGKGRQPKNNNVVKQQVDIDKQIWQNQVAQWQYRGTGKNDASDSQESQEQRNNAEESIQAINIKKKLNEKLKAMENKGSLGSNTGGTNSLLAKAEQLRRKNQQAGKGLKNEVTKGQMKHSQIKEMKQQQDQSDIDDHWDKINKQKAGQKNKSNGPKKQLTHQEVVNFYQTKQLLNQRQQVQNQQSGNEQQQSGCFGLFGCLRQKKKGQRKDAQKQILSLAKVQLENWQENMYILKEIWTRLTGQKFQRYGDHWNKIGFQGRDPSTDLRSTGILSIIQWYSFIWSHQQYSSKIYSFTIEIQFPLALSTIKITALFIGLLKNNKVSGRSFNQLQQIYNALHFTFFSKIMKMKIGSTPIGEFIDKNIEELKKNYSKSQKEYLAWKQTGKSIII